MKQSGNMNIGDALHFQQLRRTSRTDSSSQSLSRHSTGHDNHIDAHDRARSRAGSGGDNHVPGHNIFNHAREVVVDVLVGAAEQLQAIAMHLDGAEAQDAEEMALPAPIANSSITPTSVGMATPTRLAFQNQHDNHHTRVVEVAAGETKDAVAESDFEKEKERREREKDMKAKSKDNLAAGAADEQEELPHVAVPGVIDKDEDVVERDPGNHPHHQFHLRDIVIDHIRHEETSGHANREQQHNNAPVNHFYYFVAGGVLVLSSVIVGVVLGIEGGDVW